MGVIPTKRPNNPNVGDLWDDSQNPQLRVCVDRNKFTEEETWATHRWTGRSWEQLAQEAFPTIIVDDPTLSELIDVTNSPEPDPDEKVLQRRTLKGNSASIKIPIGSMPEDAMRNLYNLLQADQNQAKPAGEHVPGVPKMTKYVESDALLYIIAGYNSHAAKLIQPMSVEDLMKLRHAAEFLRDMADALVKARSNELTKMA